MLVMTPAARKMARKLARRREAPQVRSRTRIVACMATIMRRDFRAGKTPSPFAHEGAFIAELRAHLCLAGWPWDAADEAARAVVAEALRGIKRPSWAEGQHGWTKTEPIVGAICAWCGDPIVGELRQRYCSTRCKSAAANRRIREQAD